MSGPMAGPMAGPGQGQESIAAQGAALAEKEKKTVFATLLQDCGKWMTNETGLSELPSIHLHVADEKGNKRVLTLPASAYVMETVADEVELTIKYLMGIIPVAQPQATGKKQKVCMPAFGAVNYTTKSNGPVWILGTPLFYQFQVHYDIAAKPPTIGFVEGKCHECSAGEQPAKDALEGALKSPASLLANSVEVEDEQPRRNPNMPRKISGP